MNPYAQNVPELSRLTEMQINLVKQRTSVIFKRNKPVVFMLPTILASSCGVLAVFSVSLINAKLLGLGGPPNEIYLGLCLASATVGGLLGGLVGSRIKYHLSAHYLKIAIREIVGEVKHA